MTESLLPTNRCDERISQLVQTIETKREILETKNLGGLYDGRSGSSRSSYRCNELGRGGRETLDRGDLQRSKQTVKGCHSLIVREG